MLWLIELDLRLNEDPNMIMIFATKISDSTNAPTEADHVNAFYNLDTVNKIKLWDFMLHYCLWVGNKTGSRDQMWGDPDMMPDQKIRTLIGDCRFHHQANQMPHLSLDGMSILFGGE